MTEITQQTLLTTLKTYFGYDDFRPNQQEVIEYILNGNDALIVMPTGGGKSMCYQLPALLLEGVTIVISPLIALMKDQVDGLRQNGIPADFFHSQQTAEEKQQLVEALYHKELKLVYTAPESLNGLLHFLPKDQISLIAVDEAHCISAWGHDFRPAYTQLAHLKSQLTCPLIALTATADKATRGDILQQLNIPEAKLFLSSFNRTNLSLEVASGQKRFPQILNFIERHPNDAGIIYCLSRKNTENLAAKLNKQGYKAVAYHAGLDPQTRNQVQNQFINDEVPIICATIAFGMGIDKSNVRWVIHYNLPKNIEGYYQEIGRAGRDGLPSDTLLFYSFADVMQLRKFTESQSPQQQAIQVAKLQRMQQYAEALTCRRKILLSYFGEHLEENCGNCDICEYPPEEFDGTIIAQKALSAIARLKQREPMNVVIDLLRGAMNQHIVQNGYDQLKTHGAGKEIDWKAWQQYLIQLINQGFIEVNYQQFNRLALTETAKKVLFENQKVTLSKLTDSNERLAEISKDKQHQPFEPSDELFEKLRILRKKMADKNAVPAFTIFSDASLRDMIAKRPETETEFLAVSGVGQAKLERYGEKFIKEIVKYNKKNPPIKKTPKKAKPEKTPSMEVTTTLYNEGNSPAQIAEIRGLKLGSILNHLCQSYLADPHSVDLTLLIDKPILKQVKKAKQALDNPTGLKPYFEYFNQEISYDDLKIALAILENK